MEGQALAGKVSFDLLLQLLQDPTKSVTLK